MLQRRYSVDHCVVRLKDQDVTAPALTWDTAALEVPPGSEVCVCQVSVGKRRCWDAFFLCLAMPYVCKHPLPSLPTLGR